MNEHNHHKIIEKFTKDKSIPGIDITHILEEASDFSDDFRGILKTEFAIDPIGVLIDSPIDTLHVVITDESQFYYYHFFYNIEIEVDKNDLGKGKIILKRHKKDDPAKKPEKDDLGKNAEKYIDNLKLYYTAVNDREDYFLTGFAEGSNQSNCVAFLHAMGAKTKHEKFNENNPRRTFEEHLKKCFGEYLYLKDEKEALFMLGIALHGIMDSFTPSHAGFQVYGDQDMALHAQGDVLPIKDKKDKDDGELCLSFIPGQYNEETKIIMKALAWKKGYNDNEFLNDREYEMLRCFLIISKVAYKKNNKELDIYEIKNLCDYFQNCLVPLSKINKVLSEGYTYGKSAFDHSTIALQALENVYSILSTKRKEIRDFGGYKAAKSCCQNAVNAWRDEYKKIDTKIIFKPSYLNGFKRTSWIASAIKTGYQISKDTVIGTGEALGDMAFNAQQKAKTAFQIGKDTVVGTGEVLGNMAFNAQQKVEAAIQIGKDTVSGTGEALGNMAYDAQCTAVKIAKDILERYDQLDEKNRQINPDFNMFGGPNKA